MPRIKTDQLLSLAAASPALQRKALEIMTKGVNVETNKKYAEIPQGDLRLQILPFEEPERNGLFDDQQQTPVRFVARPQVPFRGERLIAVVSRNAQAAANGVELEATSFSVGKTPQTVSAAGGSIPLAAFEPQAVGVRLQLEDAAPGIEIAAEVGPIAPLVAGDQVVVRLLLLGTSIED